MTEATGGRRKYNCQMGAGRCGKIVLPANICTLTGRNIKLYKDTAVTI